MHHGEQEHISSLGRSFSLLAVMVLLWLVVSLGVLSGFPLRLAGVSSGRLSDTILWQGHTPAGQTDQLVLTLAWHPESLAGEDQAFGPGRPLLVTGEAGAWTLVMSEEYQPQWAPLEGEGSSFPGSGGVVFHDESSRTLVSTGLDGSISAKGWQYPRGEKLSGIWVETGGIWVNTWTSSPIPEFPSSFSGHDGHLPPLVQEHLRYLSREGDERNSWHWDHEVVADLAFDRDGAYVLSWTLNPPGDAILRRIGVSDRQEWRKVLESATPHRIHMGSSVDPVNRAVRSWEGPSRGDIAPWPGRDIILLSSPETLLAVDVTANSVFLFESKGTILDAALLAGRAVVLESLPQADVLTFLDSEGRVAARHVANPHWHSLTPAPWGHVMAWGGSSLEAFDAMSRRVLSLSLPDNLVSVLCSYGDARGSWGAVALLLSDGSLSLRRLDWNN